ncbi:MAG: hypothetical protein QOD70_2315, partial [Frankiales bacterium]|nr:hypothetical protein [Frankiales bacterium]
MIRTPATGVSDGSLEVGPACFGVTEGGRREPAYASQQRVRGAFRKAPELGQREIRC